MKALISAAMLSTAVLRMMSDEGAGGTSADPRGDKLRAAVAALDDGNDNHWNIDGKPNMLAVEAFFGDATPTREEVDAIGRVRNAAKSSAEPAASSLPLPPGVDLNPPAVNELPPVEQPPKPPATVTPCRLVMLTFDAARPFDGEVHVPGLVLKVFEDGTINVKAFAPNGGADVTVTGVHHVDDALAMPEGADRNAAMSCTWDWPPRV